MQAIKHETYEAYVAYNKKLGYSYIPESLYDALKEQDTNLFNQFYTDMMWAATEPENKNEDGSVNWNFVDSDMFMKWGVLLDGELYTEYFDKAADIMEGVE
jgi:hypothetical protein